MSHPTGPNTPPPDDDLLWMSGGPSPWSQPAPARPAEANRGGWAVDPERDTLPNIPRITDETSAQGSPERPAQGARTYEVGARAVAAAHEQPASHDTPDERGRGKRRRGEPANHPVAASHVTAPAAARAPEQHRQTDQPLTRDGIVRLLDQEAHGPIGNLGASDQLRAIHNVLQSLRPGTGTSLERTQRAHARLGELDAALPQQSQLLGTLAETADMARAQLEDPNQQPRVQHEILDSLPLWAAYQTLYAEDPDQQREGSRTLDVIHHLQTAGEDARILFYADGMEDPRNPYAEAARRVLETEDEAIARAVRAELSARGVLVRNPGPVNPSVNPQPQPLPHHVASPANHNALTPPPLGTEDVVVQSVPTPPAAPVRPLPPMMAPPTHGNVAPPVPNTPPAPQQERGFRAALRRLWSGTEETRTQQVAAPQESVQTRSHLNWNNFPELAGQTAPNPRPEAQQFQPPTRQHQEYAPSGGMAASGTPRPSRAERKAARQERKRQEQAAEQLRRAQYVPRSGMGGPS